MRIGEEIRVSGPCPALGHGDASRAIPLVTTPSTYPFWTTKESIFLPGDRNLLQYRYAVFSGGVFRRWEGKGKIMRHLEPQRVDKLNIIRATSDLLDVMPNPETSMLMNTTHLSMNNNHQTSLNTKSDMRLSKSRHFSTWGKRSKVESSSMNTKDHVIIVSYFLPVLLSKVDGKWIATWNKENILALQSGTQITDKISWVGTIRWNGAPIPVEEEMAVSQLLASMNCYPVFVNQIMHQQFYEIFCKHHLWLLLHQIADVYGPLSQSDIGAKVQQELWFAYSTVNRLFRDKVVEVYQHGDLVWIHGFHLMLLPSFLRRFLTIAKIGYFFHTPFPSSEIWRTMSRREDLLRGILAADQVGFHLYEYARHFVTTCHRVLGHGCEMNANGTLAINVDDREVVITCIHVGIDIERLSDVLHAHSFNDSIDFWRAKFQDKLTIAGVDRLERLKGIPLKLAAIDAFFSENVQWRGKVMFSIIGISAIERGDDYRITRHDVNVLVKSLNKKYAISDSDLCVYFEERHEKEFQLSTRLAYFSAADVLMITATRDGLNRFPLEFTLAQNKILQSNSNLNKDDVISNFGNENPSSFMKKNLAIPRGLIIISEFISSARVMRGALTVNPWRVDDVKQTMLTALEMDSREVKDRFRRNMEFSTRLTTTKWAIHVLNDLKTIEKIENPSECMTVGFGMGHKVMNIRAGFQVTDANILSKSYRSARSRLIVLDWGGTLVSDHDKSDRLQAYALATGQATRVGPSQELTDLLTKLSSDMRNSVFVVSGKELLAVSEYFGNVKNLGLGAEHGFYYRWPRDERVHDDTVSTTDKQSQLPEIRCKWQTLSDIGDQAWKASAKLVMNIFTQRTHGTYIEQKGNAMIWQFRDADPEFGFLQSKELEEHLKEVLAIHKEVEVIRGGGVADGYIEVRPTGVSKGRFLEYAIQALQELGKPANFVLAIGDDSSDESMFEYLSRLGEDKKDIVAYGVTVGKKPSSATSYVDDPKAVIELLGTLNRSTQRDNRFFSAVDLPSKNKQYDKTLSSVREIKEKESTLDSRSTNKHTIKSRLTHENRAMSVDNLNLSGQISSGTGGENMRKMHRTNSSSHLTISSYLESINDVDDEDDAGIFF